MRIARVSAALVAGVLSATGLATVSVTSPAAADVVPSTEVVDCTVGGPRPCIESFTVDGAPDPDFGYYASTYVVDGSTDVALTAETAGGDFQMGEAALPRVFSVTIDMGAIVPRVVSGKGQDVRVTRSRTTSPAGHRVTVTGRPVVVAGQCDQATYPWRCPEQDVVVDDPADFNNRDFVGYFGFQATDYGTWDDVEQRNAMYGLDYFTNVAATSLPPDIVRDAATDTSYLQVELANRRFREDGTTLARGRAEMRIPNAFLRTAYGVPDPQLMTGTSLTVTGPGTAATTSITQEAGDDAMVVLVDGMTFPDIGVADGELRRGAAPTSMKTVRVRRGVLTPARPEVARATRVAPRAARVVSTPATARGARVTGYQARCTAGRNTVLARAAAPAVVVRGLQVGRGYACQVRAWSKVGPSRWSETRRVAARP